MFRTIAVIVFLCIHFMCATAQEIVVRNNDSIRHIELPEVEVVKMTRKQRREYKRMERLEYNVRKAYPYARIAAEKVAEIEKKIAKTKNKAEQERIIKKEYKELMSTFKKPLMKLTISQGKILIRLVYRETNNTSFAHIKEYKGSFNAYFWQSLALLFGNNLKSVYDPKGEDNEIEEIVRKIEAGI